MSSPKNALLQKLALLGLVSSVGIGAGTHVVGQAAMPPDSARYEAAVEEARTLAEMAAVNPESPAARQALIRLQAVLAQLPPAVRASVISEIAMTSSLPASVLASVLETLPEVALASVATPSAQQYP